MYYGYIFEYDNEILHKIYSFHNPRVIDKNNKNLKVLRFCFEKKFKIETDEMMILGNQPRNKKIIKYHTLSNIENITIPINNPIY